MLINFWRPHFFKFLAQVPRHGTEQEPHPPLHETSLNARAPTPVWATQSMPMMANADDGASGSMSSCLT
jgi:hypothetical protein